jgi:hypothetical protein
MAVNQVTAANLQKGIDIVFARLKQQSRGGKGIWSFHNDLYRKLEEYRLSGIDPRCWSFLLDSLAQWKAIRGTVDHTKESIGEKGLHLLPVLRERFNNLVGQQLITLPTIENIIWEDIEPLFLVAKDIKGVEGPMFASKLCHFLLPSAFFVFDNTLIKRGWANYRQYWQDCQAAWMAVSDTEILKKLLKNNMPSHCTPCVTYPWPTKITELCQFEVK